MHEAGTASCNPNSTCTIRAVKDAEGEAKPVP